MRLIRRWLDRLGFLGVSSGVFVFGFVQGTYPLTFRLDLAFIVLAVVLLQAVVSSLMFTGFVSASTATFLWNLRSEDRSPPPRTGPSVTAIVPVYGDANVLDRSVESLLSSTYENLDVCIVCEPGDDASKRRAADLASRAGVSRLVNTRYPGSKAGAINYAVEATDSDHVAVFDADERVHPEFVAAAVQQLTECDVVQGRTVPQPEGLVEELAYYESVLLSYVSRRLLYVATGFRMAASRSVVMSRNAIEQVGGYDTEMLTEDFDFAYECYQARLDVRELLSRPSRIEAAHSLGDWWGQRKRWMTGYSQVLHKQLATVRPLTDYRNLASAAICAGTVLGSLLMLSMLSKFGVLVLVGAREFALLPLVTVVGATALVRLHDWRQGTVPHLGWAWLVVPLVLPLYSLTAIKAVIEYVTTWDGDWYQVEKGG